MWLFGPTLEQKIRRRFRHLDTVLTSSFSRVKGDTSNLRQWVAYLNQKSQQQEAHIKAISDEIANLNDELSVMPKTPEDVKRIIDAYYSYDSMLNRIRSMETRVEELVLGRQLPPTEERQLQSTIAPSYAEIDILRRKIEALEHKKLSLKEKIVKRVTRNSKEYLKGVIVSYIRKYEQVTALQLKEMVVDDQQLCSKSSFYRLMEEIEDEQEIGVVREGKEKHYFLKVMRKHG